LNRVPVFLAPADYAIYRARLRVVLSDDGIALHAYALMGNHVHLLLTEPRSGALARALSRLGAHYVPRFNRRYERTGALWEGRHRSSLVATDQYLLAVHRYIDLNPVRAGIVAKAEEYPWSSARANLGLADDPLLTPHGAMAAYRESGFYQAMLETPVAPAELACIRAHARQERVLGSDAFQELVSAKLGRPVALRARGRPSLAQG
jgi:putative transposase